MASLGTFIETLGTVLSGILTLNCRLSLPPLPSFTSTASPKVFASVSAPGIQLREPATLRVMPAGAPARRVKASGSPSGSLAIMGVLYGLPDRPSGSVLVPMSGARFGAGLTVTVTLDGALAAPWLSVTTRVKV